MTAEVQLHFLNSIDATFFVPLLNDRLKAEEAVRLISERSIWQGRPRGEVAVSLGGGNIFVIDPQSFSLRREVAHENLKEKFSGLILLTPNLSDVDAERLENLSEHLRKRSPVFVIEERADSRVDREKRAEILIDLGLVEVKVLIRKSKQFVFWEGRREKTRKGKRPIDLTSAENPKNYNWARNTWKKMEATYKSRGFKIKDPKTSQILDVLRKSRNPPKDIESLRNGWGVVVIAPCNCEWKVSLEGNWERIVRCGDQGCKGLPET